MREGIFPDYPNSRAPQFDFSNGQLVVPHPLTSREEIQEPFVREQQIDPKDYPGSAHSRFLGKRIEKLYLLPHPRNERNGDGYMMGCIKRSSYHPVTARNTRLLCHGSDIGRIVIRIFNNIVVKFHFFAPDSLPTYKRLLI